MQCLGCADVRQPRRQRGLVVGMQRCGVDVAAVTVGRDDGQRSGIGVKGQVGADHREPEPAALAVLGQPGGQLARLERAAPHVEALVDLGIGRRQRVEQPVPQHPELQVVEEPMNVVAVPRLHP